MIFQRLNFNSFKNAFKEAGRADQFSEYGLQMLYRWFDDCDFDIELDVIAVCCHFAEYTLEEFLGDFELDGIDSIKSLKQALVNGDIDYVLGYDIRKDVIILNN